MSSWPAVARPLLKRSRHSIREKDGGGSGCWARGIALGMDAGQRKLAFAEYANRRPIRTKFAGMIGDIGGNSALDSITRH
jgi:hypothetical protein